VLLWTTTLIVAWPGAGFAQTADVIREVQGWDPEGEFQWGLDHRSDSAAAKPIFRGAAEMFDSDWAKRRPTPALALNRGRAHFLAGDLPKAIRAFRDGLDLFPWDAELQRSLVLARAAVAYPTEADPAARVRPDPPAWLRSHVSPWDLFLAASACSLLVTIGLARRFTARDGWAAPLAVVGLVGLIVVAAVAVKIDADARADRANPVLVLVADEVLRTGNGTAFPARIDAPLPRGAEVRELARRGGWVQVELPGGAVGWVRESAVLGAEEERTTESQRTPREETPRGKQS
jgi:hypothetical protein